VPLARFDELVGQAAAGDTCLIEKEITEKDKLRIENLIVDESSMVDFFKFSILFSIITLDKIKRIILVGDEFQLPPIVFGKPFRDLIDYVSLNPSLKENHHIRLESNCRKEKLDETMLDLAEIYTSKKRNYEPILNKVDKDNFQSPSLDVFKWKNKDELRQKLETEIDNLLGIEDISELAKALNCALGLYDNGHVPGGVLKNAKIDSIQVISPYRSGHYGTLNLNKVIQKDYRKGYRYTNSVFGHSDKIIRLYNWYWGKELKLSNGSMEIVTYHQYEKRYFFNELDSYLKKVDDEDNFELASAITVHKSQGSDFENVFLVIPKRFSLLSKELVYTALTRPKKKMSLFVQEDIEGSLLEVARNRSFVDDRNTSIFTEPTE
jgi:ATP-dependent exoDNAse (exonuclease V) alpha subunit